MNRPDSGQPWGAVSKALGAIASGDASLRAWAHVASLEALRALGDYDAEGPLAGSPFGVKDVIDVANMPTRCGSAASSDAPVRFDAGCVAALRRAGAVPVGKTVTAEYAFRAPGPTRNPHHAGHTPGGSSSGSAAAVASGMVPLALSTQTGGSIIRPAAYCGVVGFKPSFGAVPRDGLAMTSESLDVIGWHASSVAVAAQVARILTPYRLAGDAARRAPRRIALVATTPGQALEPDGERELMRVRERLIAHGIACDPARAYTQADELCSIHETVMQYELARCIAPVAWCHGHQLSEALRETVARGLRIDPGQYLARRAAQQTLRHAWDSMFGDADLILTPSASGPAPAGLGSTGASAFNRVWSALGWPCLHLPSGRAAGGLPVGVQLVGRFEADMDLLAWGDRIAAMVRGAA